MIFNRPLGIALIVAFTLITNVINIITTINYGIEVIIFPVVIFNYVFPLLLIIGSLGLWFNKLWGWWLQVTVTGIIIVSAISYLVKIPFGMYLSYLIGNAFVILTASLIFYYLFNRNILSAFNIPLDQRPFILKRCLSISIIFGLLSLLILPGVNDL